VPWAFLSLYACSSLGCEDCSFNWVELVEVQRAEVLRGYEANSNVFETSVLGVLQQISRQDLRMGCECKVLADQAI
jgi:hypothetical protein